jgi:hypothetical protein
VTDWNAMPPVERWAFAAVTSRRCARTPNPELRSEWKRDAEHWERMVRSFADALIATWKTP